jgi:hypothetical protein
MSQPILQVLVGFQTTANFGQPFQLDDAVYGKLDTGTLGGIQFADLTSMVQSVNINRGRSRQLQEFNAGTATISFWNKSRALDPLNTASPYWNATANMTGIVPRLPVQILANGIPIYTGVIQDWNVDYDLGNNDIVYASCADDFTVLASATLGNNTVVEQQTGARIDTVLNYGEVLYQGARSIATGSSTLGGTAADADFSIQQGTSVLNYLQDVTNAEQGYLFMSAQGTLTFKGRSQVLNPISRATFTGDDSVGIRYQTLSNEFGDELLYNVIVTEGPAGGPFTAIDNDSVAQYQAQTYSQTDLLNSTTTELQGLGNYLLGKYKQPQLRFNGLSTQLLALNYTEQNQCLSLDLTDICSVVKHFVVGSPSSVDQTVIVTGINHSITPGSHIMTLTFESTDGNAYLTLDDPIFGTLDNNLLSF